MLRFGKVGGVSVLGDEAHSVAAVRAMSNESRCMHGTTYRVQPAHVEAGTNAPAVSAGDEHKRKLFVAGREAG